MKIIKMSDQKKRTVTGVLVLMLISCSALFDSCVSVKKYVYFKDIPDTIVKSVTIDHVTPYKDPKIEPSDLLSITVQPMLRNLMTSSPGGGSGETQASGQLGQVNIFPVDKDGYIEYPLIGRQKVAGLSTSEAREMLREKSLYYYKDPVVNVRITNFNILVLGDVPKPGIFTSPSEKVSIMDAIGYAGDLLYSAKRDDILLIRTEGDQKICARYDITTSKIFQSEYYYLKQNDIIYVEPNKYKVQSSDQSFIRNLGVLSSIISIASILLVYKSIK